MLSLILKFLDQTNGNEPSQNLLVTVFEEDGTTLVTYGRTGLSGSISVVLPPGTYILRTFKLGVTSTEETVTFSTSGTLLFYVSTTLTAPPPSPQVCRLYANFVSLDGTPYKQFKLQIQSLFDPMAANGLAVVEKTFNVETDDAGHVEFDVVRGARIRVTFVTTPLSREIVVPNKGIENLMTAMGAATDAFRVVRR